MNTQRLSRQLARFVSLLTLLTFVVLPIKADPVVLIQQGRAALVAKDIVTAHARFQQALAEDPNNATGNLFYAATRIVALSKQPAANTVMDHLGLTATGRDIYKWQSKFATNSSGDVIVPANVSAAEVFTFIHDQLIPQLIGAETNLAKITDSSFIIGVTAAETSIDDATIDYGDIQVIRAILRAYQLFFYSVTAWNTDVQLTSIHQVFPEKISDIETVLRNYPNLFGAGSDADLPKAQASFVAAIQTYFQGSSFIRARAARLIRLFNLDTTDLPDELKFRNDLEDLNSSLTTPVRLRSNTNITVWAAKFFERVQAPRQYLPRFSANRWVAGTIPDFTFGGVVQGLDKDSFELHLAEKAEPASLFSQVKPSKIDQMSVLQLSLNVATDHEMAIDVSSNLVDWAEYDRIQPDFNAPTNKLLFYAELTTNGPPRFFRASSDPTDFHVEVYNNGGLILENATVTITAGDKTMTLTRGAFGLYSIGVRFLPKAEVYTLTVSAPGYSSGTLLVGGDVVEYGGYRNFQLFPESFVAPSSLSGHSYYYTDLATSGTFSFSGNTYNNRYVRGIEQGNLTGTFMATRDSDTWSLTLLNSNQGVSGTLILQFTTSTSGRYIFGSSVGEFFAMQQ